VFSHIHELQFDATPDAPDPAFARRFQEVLGGKWGEMTVALQYLYQGWNCRPPRKYKDMLLDIGTEELAHVEMITTMIDRLLDSSPLSEGEATGRRRTSCRWTRARRGTRCSRPRRTAAYGRCSSPPRDRPGRGVSGGQRSTVSPRAGTTTSVPRP
jgi:hypothetical protein